MTQALPGRGNLKRTGLIAPSIAASDLGRLREEIKDLESSGVDLIHVDVMDGAFVPNLTFGPWVLDVIRSVSKLPLDCHLMVTRPQDWIPVFAHAGADRITVHVESTPHIHRHIESIRKTGKKAGVSFNPGNPVCMVEELLDWVDVVQVMGVDPGFSGQDFISNSIAKVRRLSELRKSRDYLIKVDGGISPENITSLKAAGADIFVLGSSIFSTPNRAAAISGFKALLR